jgi:iron-sulfur cluster assembly accessory protein
MGILRVMINVSETAASKISELLVEEQKAGGGLRVFVQGGGCSGFQYGLMIEENGQGSGDQVFESHGIKGADVLNEQERPTLRCW